MFFLLLFLHIGNYIYIYIYIYIYSEKESNKLKRFVSSTINERVDLDTFSSKRKKSIKKRKEKKERRKKEKKKEEKETFLTVNTLRCKGGRYSILWIPPLTLGSFLIMLSVKQRRHQIPFFESLVWLDFGLNPGLPEHWRPYKFIDVWLKTTSHTFFKNNFMFFFFWISC